MTNEEAVTIIRKEYLCVDRDCDIEKNCGKCDLVMPSKEPILEAYNLAIKALEQEPSYYPPCIDCHKKMDEIRRAYDKLKEQEPCTNAISRQDALRAFMYATNGERLPDYDCDNYPVTYDLRCIKKTLRALPPVNLQPKTGYWISLDDFRGKYNENGFKCSECGEHSDFEENFCPNCGCRMFEPQESEG